MKSNASHTRNATQQRADGRKGLGFEAPNVTQLASMPAVFAAPTPSAGNTSQNGLPNALRSGIENLSGMAMSDVQVHYNSSKPAQLRAHAFAQGNQIHVAPGQERHLPHEAWHVVQQKQGRVKPTAQLKKGIAVNDEPALEREADVMGAKAARLGDSTTTSAPLQAKAATAEVMQPIWIKGPDVYQWHCGLDGLQWYLIKATGQLFYEVLDYDLRSNGYIADNEGDLKARTLDEWLADRQMWAARQDDRAYQSAEEIASIEPTGNKALAKHAKRRNFLRAIAELPETHRSQIAGIQEQAHDITRALTEPSASAASSQRKEVNYKCDGFADMFQQRLTKMGVSFMPLCFTFQPQVKFHREHAAPTITLNEPGHAYDNTQVGIEIHYATMIVVNGRKIVYDNHHPKGEELSRYLGALDFDIYAEAADRTVVHELVDRNAILKQGRIVVLELSPAQFDKKLKTANKGYLQDLARESLR